MIKKFILLTRLVVPKKKKTLATATLIKKGLSKVVFN